MASSSLNASKKGREIIRSMFIDWVYVIINLIKTVLESGKLIQLTKTDSQTTEVFTFN